MPEKKNKQLQANAREIARLTVGSGPVAIGAVPGAAGSFLITSTTQETVGHYTVDFDLDADVRRFLTDQGIEIGGYKTTGQTTFDVQQTVPVPIVVSANGEIISNASTSSFWKQVLNDAHYRPISVHNLDNKWIVFLASSGANGEEVPGLGDIIGVELSASDTSILAVYPIGKIDGHASRGYKAIELTKTQAAVLVADDLDRIQAIRFDMATKETKTSFFDAHELPNTKRILQHDRRSTSGLPRSWVVELLPGIYTLETMGDEVL